MFDSYKKRLTVNGSTYRERQIRYAQAYNLRNAPDNIAFKTVKIDDVERHLLVVSTAVTSEKIIRTCPGESFLVGQIVLWNNSHWLITEKDNDDDVTVRGRMEQCNRQLRWQNPSTGEIIERWCTAKKPYYSNIDNDIQISTSTREYKVQIPYDDETSLLALDKRFMVEVIAGEPKTYILTSVDAITERYDRDEGVSGFLVLNIKQDSFNPQVDNTDLMLCDYFELDDPIIETGSSQVNNASAEITYIGKPTVKIGGSAKKFAMALTDYPEDKTPNVTWDVELPVDRNRDQYILDNDEAVLRIKVADDAILEGDKLVIKATDTTIGLSAALEIEVIA